MTYELSVAPNIAIIDEIMEKAPKEGYIASVVLGVLESIKEVLKDVESAKKKIECIAAARNSCSKPLCDPRCGGLFKIDVNGSVSIVKQKNNPFSIRIVDGRVEIANKKAKITLDRSIMEISLPSKGDWETVQVNLGDVDSVYKNVYTIKYAMKTVIGPMRKAISTLDNCAKSQALTC